MEGLLQALGFEGTDLWLIAARASFVGALLALFGTSLFQSAVVARAPELGHGAVSKLSAASLGTTRRILLLAAVAWFLWLLIAVAVMAESLTLGEAIALLPQALLHTTFGHVMAAQALALAAMALLLGRNWPAATIAGGIAILLQAGHSHAFAMSSDPTALLAAQGVHLLAAGAWFGGLIPLFHAARTQPPAIAAVAARRFSWMIGLPAMAAIVATALFQATTLVGGWSGLFGTPYGTVLLLKTVLLLLVLGLAALNRLRFTPGLLRDDPLSAKRRLGRSIAAEMILGLLLIVAAATLSSLEPGMHAHHAAHGARPPA